MTPWSSEILHFFLHTHKKNTLTREICQALLLTDYVIKCRYFFHNDFEYEWDLWEGYMLSLLLGLVIVCMQEPLRAMCGCGQVGNKGFSRAYSDSLSRLQLVVCFCSGDLEFKREGRQREQKDIFSLKKKCPTSSY